MQKITPSPVEESAWGGYYVFAAADRQQTGSRVGYTSHMVESGTWRQP